MSEYFGLFLRNSARNGDIPEEFPGSREGQNIRRGVLAPVFAVQGFDLTVWKNRDGDDASGGPRRDFGEPAAQASRARMRGSDLNHAYLKAQACPPLPVNAS